MPVSFSLALAAAALAAPAGALTVSVQVDDGAFVAEEGLALNLGDCAHPERVVGRLVLGLEGAPQAPSGEDLRLVLWLQRDDRACAWGRGDAGLLAEVPVSATTQVRGLALPSLELPLAAGLGEPGALRAGALLAHAGPDICERRHARRAQRWQICAALGPDDGLLLNAERAIVGRHLFWVGTAPPAPPTWEALRPGHLQVHGTARASAAGAEAAAIEIYWRPTSPGGDACRLWAGPEADGVGKGAVDVDLSSVRAGEVPEADFRVPLDPAVTFAFCARQRDRAGNTSSWAAPAVGVRSEHAAGLFAAADARLTPGHGCAAAPPAWAAGVGALGALWRRGRSGARRQPRGQSGG